MNRNNDGRFKINKYNLLGISKHFKYNKDTQDNHYNSKTKAIFSTNNADYRIKHSGRSTPKKLFFSDGGFFGTNYLSAVQIWIFKKKTMDCKFDANALKYNLSNI